MLKNWLMIIATQNIRLAIY